MYSYYLNKDLLPEYLLSPCTSVWDLEATACIVPSGHLTADLKHLILAVYSAPLFRHSGTLALGNIPKDYHLYWFILLKNLKCSPREGKWKKRVMEGGFHQH